jgi:PBSX family phage portal protein
MTDTEQPQDKEPVMKAHFVGRDGSEQSNVLETDEATRRLFSNKGAVEPPLDPVTLAYLFEMSGSLRTNIDAYATNIDGFGYTFAPTLDLEDDETAEKVKQAMIEEQILNTVQPDSPQEQAKALLRKNSIGARTAVHKRGNLGDDGEPTGADDADDVDLVEPSDAEVQARIAAIEREMTRERMRLDRFFEFCCVDESFTGLRMKTRQDLETLGNAYWEVLRNKNGDIVQFTYIPGFTMRLMPQDKKPIEVEMPVRTTDITETTETVWKRFRQYLQIIETKSRSIVYFKEFGDPRCVSAKTGHVYKDADELEREEPGVVAATELIHFKVHNSRTPYGVPRWVSEMLSVLGNRHADEINLAYFENKAIPPMILAVVNGRLGKEDVTKFENFFKSEIRGKRNFHSVPIVEVETPGIVGGQTNGVPKLDVIKLRDVQQDDAMFMKYREANTDALGSVFRLPRLIRGDSRDFNRATAQTALEMAEQQVFAPLRREFDFIINRRVLSDFGVRFWRFESKSPDFSDPNELLKAVGDAARAGYATPEELRELASRGFDHEFGKIDEEWATARPLQLTLESMKGGMVDHTGAEMDFEIVDTPDPEAPPANGPGTGEPPKTAQEPEEKPEGDKKKDPVEQALALPKLDDMAFEVARILKIRDIAEQQGYFDAIDQMHEDSDDV